MGANRSRTQRGQAIVMIGLVIVVLFGFVGLALDGGRAYLDRREMQAAVDQLNQLVPSTGPPLPAPVYCASAFQDGA